MYRLLLAVLSVAPACWTSPAAALSTTPPPEPVATRRPAPVNTPPCVARANALISAKQVYECADASFSAGDYVNADRLTVRLREQFPYSRYAMLGLLIQGEARVKLRDHIGAVNAYDAWLRDNPTHAKFSEIRHRREEAMTRLHEP